MAGLLDTEAPTCYAWVMYNHGFTVTRPQPLLAVTKEGTEFAYEIGTCGELNIIYIGCDTGKRYVIHVMAPGTWLDITPF